MTTVSSKHQDKLRRATAGRVGAKRVNTPRKRFGRVTDQARTVATNRGMPRYSDTISDENIHYFLSILSRLASSLLPDNDER